MRNKKYRSKISKAIHETATDFFNAGVMNKETMREFDNSCLVPVSQLTADEIRNIRERENVSQVVFANYLNVSKGIISQWERGEKHPSGAALKLSSLVAHKGLDVLAV